MKHVTVKRNYLKKQFLTGGGVCYMVINWVTYVGSLGNNSFPYTSLEHLIVFMV